jgi:spore coat polysaccharide biosynthesis predicted glycosyltransferase SpsG
MFNSYDPEYYDQNLIRSVAQYSNRSILLTSSRTAPDHLPVDTVVGHFLNKEGEQTYVLKSGLEYAPVDPSVRHYRPSRIKIRKKIEKIFVEFGNWGDPTGLRLTLEAICDSDFRGKVDVLVPSALLSYEREFKALVEEATYDGEFYHAVPSVPELMTEADIAIGTYGNITYEAMGVGTPFLIVAVKPFMVEYARQLEDNRLAVCAGLADELRTSEVASHIESMTRSRRREYAERGWEAVDGCGLKRTAELIDRQRA